LTGTLGFVRAAGENVGTYAITPSGLTSSNYSVIFSNGNLSITPAALSVTASNNTKIYGATDPALTATISGFVNGESPAVLGGVLSVTRASGENVGNYAVTPSGLTSSNYSITFHTGTLSITKAALSVTANDASKPFGAADPTFTARYSGFVNGDASAALSGTLAFTRSPGETVGNYSITPAGLTSSNYAITFNTGTLTITTTAPPQIFPISGAGTDITVISWAAVSNVTYHVQYSTNLTSPWLDLPPDITATNSIASTTDHPTAAMRFYRVLIP
jgi:hypothetical protein